ncbi:MAG: rRNA adenine N-6-methyltransferase family protein, partial [Terriglobales bacterium]
MKAPRGQNFLYQPQWQRRVADAIVAPGTQVERLVEIGGGPGGLSELLAARARRLWVIENDRALAEGLRRRFAGRDWVVVVEQNVLAVDFRALADPGRLDVAGNLPYYITSP